MELKTCKEKTQKGEITWSLHLYLWPLRGSKHGAVPDRESVGWRRVVDPLDQ